MWKKLFAIVIPLFCDSWAWFHGQWILDFRSPAWTTHRLNILFSWEKGFKERVIDIISRQSRGGWDSETMKEKCSYKRDKKNGRSYLHTRSLHSEPNTKPKCVGRKEPAFFFPFIFLSFSFHFDCYCLFFGLIIYIYIYMNL